MSVLDFFPPAVVSCHEAWNVDVGGQVPRCAQSGTANCTVAVHLIYDASSYEEGQTSHAEVPLSSTPVLANVSYLENGLRIRFHCSCITR